MALGLLWTVEISIRCSRSAEPRRERSTGNREAGTERWQNVRVCKEILEAARKGGPAKPQAEADAGAGEPEAAEAAAAVEASRRSHGRVPRRRPRAPPADVPTPSTLGRPLTLKEKLAAARAGGAAPPARRPPRRGRARAGEPPRPRRPRRPPAERQGRARRRPSRWAGR